MVRPQGFVHVESWREAIEALHFGLAGLGIRAPVCENRVEPGATPIVFGSHLLAPPEQRVLPEDAILYNLEQMIPGYPWYREQYLELLGRFRVWDYSDRNVRELGARGIDARHVPLGYVPQFTRIHQAEEDVDILFYGLLSERRKSVLDALASRGLRVVALNGVFGRERDDWIARAKVVLNLRFAEGGMFEDLRVLYLLSNRKAVVSECDDGELAADLRGALCMAAYDGLAEACADLVRDPARRRALAEGGYAAVSAPARHMSAILGGILDS